MTRFADLPSAQFGRLGEIAAMRAFQRQGHSALALFKSCDDSAPVLESSGGRLTSPDLALYKGGSGFAVEIKTHSISPYNEWLKSQVHGIHVRKFNDYAEWSATTGMALYLGIVELSSASLLLSSRPMIELPKWPCQCGPCRGKRPNECRANRRAIGKPEWYFKRDSFDVRVRLDDRTVSDLRVASFKVLAADRRSPTAETPRQVSWLDANAAIADTDRGGMHWHETSARGRR